MTEVVSENSEVTVLLVDDNPQNLKVLYETLKDQGYRLLIANEGEKALDLARRHQPEVVLLDIMMPEMDGYEVCQRLKADPEAADCAVVFLSALDDLQAKVKGFSWRRRLHIQAFPVPGSHCQGKDSCPCYSA